MSLVTFKRQVSMKQPGQRLSVVLQRKLWGGNGCTASSGLVTFVPHACWYEKAHPLLQGLWPRLRALPSRAPQTQFPCISLLINVFPAKSTRFFERSLRLLTEVNPFTHYFCLNMRGVNDEINNSTWLFLGLKNLSFWFQSLSARLSLHPSSIPLSFLHPTLHPSLYPSTHSPFLPPSILLSFHSSVLFLIAISCERQDFFFLSTSLLCPPDPGSQSPPNPSLILLTLPQTTCRSVNSFLVLISNLSLHWINPNSFCLQKYHFYPCCPSVAIILGLLLAENQVPWMPHLHKIVSALVSPLKVMSRRTHVTSWYHYVFIFVFEIVYFLFCLTQYFKLPESKIVS